MRPRLIVLDPASFPEERPYRELGLPVRFIGTGERIEDLALFDADQFVDGLFE